MAEGRQKELVFGAFSKQQWKGVVLAARPEVTDEEYDEMWDGFMQLNKQIEQAEREINNARDN